MSLWVLHTCKNSAGVKLKNIYLCAEMSSSSVCLCCLCFSNSGLNSVSEIRFTVLKTKSIIVGSFVIISLRFSRFQIFRVEGQLVLLVKQTVHSAKDADRDGVRGCFTIVCTCTLPKTVGVV